MHRLGRRPNRDHRRDQHDRHRDAGRDHGSAAETLMATRTLTRVIVAPAARMP
jgi:hypothetical protein